MRGSEFSAMPNHAEPKTVWSEWEESGQHRVRGECLDPHEFLKRPKFLIREARSTKVWCEEGDLNPHAIAGTSPSS